MIKKFGTAQWQGDLKTGTGMISTESGALKNIQYGFKKRFEDEPGSNPEEIIGAAHAACFSMALSKELGEFDITANAIDACSTITLDKKGGGFAITASHLDVHVNAEGDETDIKYAAKTAKENCPVSKLLKADITMGLKINEG